MRQVFRAARFHIALFELFLALYIGSDAGFGIEFRRLFGGNWLPAALGARPLAASELRDVVKGAHDVGEVALVGLLELEACYGAVGYVAARIAQAPRERLIQSDISTDHAGVFDQLLNLARFAF